MDKREKIIILVKDAGIIAAVIALARKTLARAALRFDRILVNHDVHLPERNRFREEWIPAKFGILGGDTIGTGSNLFSDQERVQIISAAEQVCNRTFAFLGSGTLHFTEAMPWHTDMISGYTWPMIFFADIEGDIGSPAYFNRGCDIKLPWELSRLQFLVTLGQAYRLTGDRRYFQEFVDLTTDWIAHNPIKLGCNWACPMDVAIRGVSLCAAAVLFRELILEEPGFSRVLFQQLLNTGRFVAGHLEADLYGHGNNHYLANLAGLLFIGLMLRKTAPEGERWLNTALTGLERESIWQVNEDGGSFEGSLSYHRLATEIMLISAIAAQQNGVSFSSEYLQRLEKMCQFVQVYLKPDGMTPVFGDADDARFLILGGFGKMDVRDHRHILAVAGVFFNRSDLYSSAGFNQLDCKWLFGSQQPDGNKAVAVPSLAVYPDTGFVRYLKDGVYILVKCGPLGMKGLGTHDHNDQLSFELNIDGCDIIVDSGSRAYTGNRVLRQRYRSVSAHNVTRYEGWEQNIIKDESLGDLFCMHSSNAGELLNAEESDTGFVFSGKIKQGQSGVELVRTMILDCGCGILEINDALIGAEQGSSSRTRLHLSPEIQILELLGRTAVLRAGSADGDKAVAIFIEASGPLSAERADISRSYGIAHQSTVLQWSGGSSSRVIIKFKEVSQC